MYDVLYPVIRHSRARNKRECSYVSYTIVVAVAKPVAVVLTGVATGGACSLMEMVTVPVVAPPPRLPDIEHALVDWSASSDCIAPGSASSSFGMPSGSDASRIRLKSDFSSSSARCFSAHMHTQQLCVCGLLLLMGVMLVAMAWLVQYLRLSASF